MATFDVSQLTSGLKGSVLAAGDDGYDAARRVWNGTVDKNPALVVSCLDSDDVVSAVDFARAHDLGIAVRSAGHHVTGSSVLQDGLVIDLTPMNTVEVDQATGRARVQGGATIGDTDAATQRHGLAVPLGVVSDTGVAGLTLAGGYGWMRRKHGLSCDNVISADVVTAQGREFHVDDDEHPDLLWALRGGGWDLGAVTRLEYQAHPVGPDVFLVLVAFPLGEGRQVLTRLREFMQTAPREFAPVAICLTFEEGEAYPPELWGQEAVALAAPFLGDAADGQRIGAQVTGFGSPLADLSGVLPWVQVQQAFDADYPRGRRYYWRSVHLTDLTPDAMEVLVDLGARRPSPLSTLDVWCNGGAIADLANDATPIGDRTAPFMVGIEANWDDPAQDAANIAWAREVASRLQPFSSGGLYLNFDDLADAASLGKAHGANAERLATVKHHYDPTNLFRSRGLV